MSETEKDKQSSSKVSEQLESSLRKTQENPSQMPTVQEITNVLMAVEDPELHINIVDLGLVYKIDRDEEAGKITLDMTLTSPACPFGPQMLTQTHTMLSRLPKVKEIKINTVWTPKWDPRVHASDVAQMLLGLI